MGSKVTSQKLLEGDNTTNLKVLIIFKWKIYKNLKQQIHLVLSVTFKLRRAKIDATVIDATVIEATVIDATVIDATAIDATVIYATAIDAT